MKIIIFRHGEKQEKTESQDVEVNRSIALSDVGIKQIETLANHLYKKFPEFIGLDYIHSSPFPRTMQGAEIVRRKLKIREIKPDVVLKEFYAFKDYRLPKEQRKAMHQVAMDNLDQVNETGYSYRQRAHEVLDFIRKQYQEGTDKMIISGHGALIRATIQAIDEAYYKSNLHTEMPEGGYVVVDYDGKKFSVIEQGK